MGKRKIFGILVRGLAVVSTIAAAILMATAHERIYTYNSSYQIEYTDFPLFKYFVIVNACASVYGFLVLFLPSRSLLWNLVVALDLIITLLLTSGVAGAAAIVYIGKKGNPRTTWLPICGVASVFCNRLIAALATGTVGILFYLISLFNCLQNALDPLLLHET